MWVPAVVLSGHRREGVAKMTAVRREPVVRAPAPALVVEGPVVAVARDPALLLQLHQGLHLGHKGRRYVEGVGAGQRLSFIK